MKFELNQMMCLSGRTIRKMSTVGVNQEPINQKYKINNKKKEKGNARHDNDGSWILTVADAHACTITHWLFGHMKYISRPKSVFF